MLVEIREHVGRDQRTWAEIREHVGRDQRTCG